MTCPCGNQTASTCKLSHLFGLISLWCAALVGAHPRGAAIVSEFAELMDVWSSEVVQRPQHLVLTSHIIMESRANYGTLDKWIGYSSTLSYDKLSLSVRGACADPPPQEWPIDKSVWQDGQCVLLFPENTTHKSDQLIRIEGVFAQDFNIWIANLYVIAARLVDIELPRNQISRPVNVWTANVTWQSAPAVDDNYTGNFTVYPPTNWHHEGATFVNPCGPPLTTLISTACYDCRILQCDRSCTNSAALPACNGTIPVPSAIAAFTDAGAGDLLLQSLSTEGCDEPVAHVVPRACEISAPAGASGSPDMMYIYSDGIPGATTAFNESIAGAPGNAPAGRFLTADQPIVQTLREQSYADVPVSLTSFTVPPTSSEVPYTAPSPRGTSQLPSPSLAQVSGSDQAVLDQPTWVVIGIIVASIAIALFSTLLLILLQPCHGRASLDAPSSANAMAVSDKSALTRSMERSDGGREGHGATHSTGGEYFNDRGSDGGAESTVSAVSVALRNNVDCGRPDARSADWVRDRRSPEAIEASVHALSRDRIASVLQVSLEQADMYMHHALGHKIPSFGDSSLSAASARSSRSHGKHTINYGMRPESLSEVSLSVASAAAASSAAADTSRPRSDSRESQRPQGMPYFPSSLSYSTSAADHAHGHHHQSTHPADRFIPQQIRGYSVAAPQWVQSAGSEASARGFSALPGCQEEPHENSPQWRQSVMLQAFARPQWRGLGGAAQHAQPVAWGSLGRHSSRTETPPVNSGGGSARGAGFKSRHLTELYGEPERWPVAPPDLQRWTLHEEPGRQQEGAERVKAARDWVPGYGMTGESRMHHVGHHLLQHQLVHQRQQQERLALQHE